MTRNGKTQKNKIKGQLQNTKQYHQLSKKVDTGDHQGSSLTGRMHCLPFSKEIPQPATQKDNMFTVHFSKANTVFVNSCSHLFRQKSNLFLQNQKRKNCFIICGCVLNLMVTIFSPLVKQLFCRVNFSSVKLASVSLYSKTWRCWHLGYTINPHYHIIK